MPLVHNAYPTWAAQSVNTLGNVIRYAPAIAAKAHSQKRNTNRSWRMDETYIKVKGKEVISVIIIKTRRII
jgi:transposase-like protein